MYRSETRLLRCIAMAERFREKWQLPTLIWCTRGVHGAADVGGSCPRPPTLVVDRPGGVLGPHIPGHGQVGRPVAGLVAQGPDADAGEVLVAVHHPHQPVHHGVQPQGIVGGVCGVVLQAGVKAVRLQVGLVQEVDAVLGAQLVPAPARSNQVTSVTWTL